MTEIGPLLNLRRVCADEARDAWQVAFDSDTAFDIEYDAGLNRLVMAGVIGEVADHARLRVYQMLLQYNSLWTETGGARMALDGAPGQVVMMFELPASELHVGRLGQVLTNMAQIRDAWRQILWGLSHPAECAEAATGRILSAGPTPQLLA